jgi:hypothetical protein
MEGMVMAGIRQQNSRREPLGFTPRTAGLASEYAREQGWDINEEQRAQTPREKQKYDGGRDYDYGAQDIPDEPVDKSHTTQNRTPGRKS